MDGKVNKTKRLSKLKQVPMIRKELIARKYLASIKNYLGFLVGNPKGRKIDEIVSRWIFVSIAKGEMKLPLIPLPRNLDLIEHDMEYIWGNRVKVDIDKISSSLRSAYKEISKVRKDIDNYNLKPIPHFRENKLKEMLPIFLWI